MTDVLNNLLIELVALSGETEWVEFKGHDERPEEIGEYLSALSNSSALHKKEKGYLVFGVENEIHKIIGTAFKPRNCKVGGPDPQNWRG